MTDQPYPPLRPQPPIRPRRRTWAWPTILGVVLLTVLHPFSPSCCSREGTERRRAAASRARRHRRLPRPSAPRPASPPAPAHRPRTPGSRLQPRCDRRYGGRRPHVRATPGLEGDVEWRLPEGTHGRIGGPAEADGLTWYQLSGMGLPYASGCITPEPGELLECPAWIGWLAAKAEDGTAYLASAEPPPCAEPPPTIISLSEQQYTLRLICFDSSRSRSQRGGPKSLTTRGSAANARRPRPMSAGSCARTSTRTGSAPTKRSRATGSR